MIIDHESHPKSRLKIREELECAPALHYFGSGWISGVIGLILGIASLGMVLVMCFPGIFGTVELAPVREAGGFRALLFGIMLIAYLSAIFSLILREKKTLDTFGLALTLIASILGGSRSTEIVSDLTPIYFGLDFLCFA